MINNFFIDLGFEINNDISTPKWEYLCLTFPKYIGLDIVRFVSSFISRMTASYAFSFFSIFPPGNYHKPEKRFEFSLLDIKILF